jgi:hypothetical protein
MFVRVCRRLVYLLLVPACLPSMRSAPWLLESAAAVLVDGYLRKKLER